MSRNTAPATCMDAAVVKESWVTGTHASMRFSCSGEGGGAAEVSRFCRGLL